MGISAIIASASFASQPKQSRKRNDHDCTLFMNSLSFRIYPHIGNDISRPKQSKHNTTSERINYYWPLATTTQTASDCHLVFLSEFSPAINSLEFILVLSLAGALYLFILTYTESVVLGLFSASTRYQTLSDTWHGAAKHCGARLKTKVMNFSISALGYYSPLSGLRMCIMNVSRLQNKAEICTLKGFLLFLLNPFKCIVYRLTLRIK